MAVSGRDLRTLLGIVSEDRSDLPADGLPLSLLTELAGQIRCERLAFFGLDSSQRELWFGQDLPDEGDVDNQPFWVHYRDCADCSYPDRSGDLRSVTKLSDFYSARQWHGTGMYSDYARPQGIEHELRLCLPAGHGRSVRLMLTRGRGPDFSARARALLALLRPHLDQAYRDAERRRQGIPALTPPAVGPAEPGRRGPQQLPDRPPPRPVTGDRAQAPGEHLRPAPGLLPHRRSRPSVPRPDSALGTPGSAPEGADTAARSMS